MEKTTKQSVLDGIANDLSHQYKTPKTILGSDTPRDLIYTPANPDSDYLRLIGSPGEPPYTRGIYPNMYRGKNFTTRQLSGLGSPEQTNERMRYLLDKGATGVSVLFDLPTIQMYDSDDPYSQGQVGMSGACVDSVEDMKVLFKNIPLDETSISIVTHYPTNTAILFPMFLVMAEEQGIPWSKLTGSVQNDVTMEELVRSGLEYISPKDCFRLQCDNISFINDNLSRWNSITLNGYNLRDFGTDIITESTIAICNGIETLTEMIRRGYTVDEIAPRMSFFFSIANDFFEEVARLRAVRRLWYRIMKHCFKATNPKAMLMRCHTQTSGITLTQKEPFNNIVRSSYQALAAVLGGTSSLHIDSFDEAYSIPTEEASLLSLRTQQILQTETAITDVVDPIGGSYYVEELTDQIEMKILTEVDDIEKAGGYIKSLYTNKLYDKISTYFTQQQIDIYNGKIKIVGKNIYTSDEEPEPIDVFKYDENVEREQCKKLEKLRQTRNNDDVEISLEALAHACKKPNRNILPYSLECAKARCTEGEIYKVIKQAMGLWKPPSFL